MLTLAIHLHVDTGVLVGLSADEQVARRLQAEYDREMAAYLVDHPDDAAMRRMAGHAFNPCPQPSTNTAQSTASQSAQQRPPRPSSTSGVAPVRYPAIGSPTGYNLQSSHVSQSMSPSIAVTWTTVDTFKNHLESRMVLGTCTMVSYWSAMDKTVSTALFVVVAMNVSPSCITDSYCWCGSCTPDKSWNVCITSCTSLQDWLCV